MVWGFLGQWLAKTATTCAGSPERCCSTSTADPDVPCAVSYMTGNRCCDCNIGSAGVHRSVRKRRSNSNSRHSSSICPQKAPLNVCPKTCTQQRSKGCAKEPGRLVKAIQAHISAESAASGASAQPALLNPPNPRQQCWPYTQHDNGAHSDSFTNAAIDLFPNNPSFCNQLWWLSWQHQQHCGQQHQQQHCGQQQTPPPAQHDEQQMRQAIREEVEEELRAEYDYKEMETEADCVARIVAVEMSCTNKIALLAQQHHLGLERIKLLVKAKGTRFQQALQENLSTAYAAGFKAGLRQAASGGGAEDDTNKQQTQQRDAAAQHNSSGSGNSKTTDSNSYNTATTNTKTSTNHEQQRDPALIPLPVSLLSKLQAGARAAPTAGACCRTLQAVPAAASTGWCLMEHDDDDDDDHSMMAMQQPCRNIAHQHSASHAGAGLFSVPDAPAAPLFRAAATATTSGAGARAGADTTLRSTLQAPLAGSIWGDGHVAAAAAVTGDAWKIGVSPPTTKAAAATRRRVHEDTEGLLGHSIGGQWKDSNNTMLDGTMMLTMPGHDEEAPGVGTAAVLAALGLG